MTAESIIERFATVLEYLILSVCFSRKKTFQSKLWWVLDDQSENWEIFDTISLFLVSHN